MELEPDLATYWSGLRNWAFVSRWWFTGIAGAFLLGLVL
jgi:hypothetical protein